MDKQVSDKETAIILELAEECLALPGDFVELGCYRGDTSLLLARLLHKCCKNYNTCGGGAGAGDAGMDIGGKRLWIYDSFEGLPEKSREDDSVAGKAFRAGELKVSKAEVVTRFKKAGLPLPVVRKGFFENLDSEKDLPEEIAFAFLDGDLYESIKVSLRLVEDKMSDGAVIIVHDYNNPQLPGVAKVVEEWLGRGWTMRRRESLAVLTRAS